MKISTNNSGRRFIGGTLVLTASTLICKIIGLLFKIPMLKYVGLEGMAYFSASYHIFMLFNSLATAGFPVALSIMISQNLRAEDSRRNSIIFRTALGFFISLGLVGSLLIFIISDPYSRFIGMPGAAHAVAAISPALFFICISSAVRGYFQGYGIMLPTAVSQIMESSGKLFLGISFAVFAINRGAGLPDIAASAISGLTAGIAAAAVYLLIRYFLSGNKICKPSAKTGTYANYRVRDVICRLSVIALPITLSSAVTSLSGVTDTAILVNGLIRSGYSEQAALSCYSSYSNLAVPLYNLVPALIIPAAVSLVPALSNAIAESDSDAQNSVTGTCMKFCLWAAVPCTAGLSVFALPILKTVFPTETEGCILAAPLLSCLAMSVVCACLITITNAILQAYSRQLLPLISMIIGAVLKAISEYLLLYTKAGTLSAPLSTFICTLSVVCINIIFIKKNTAANIKYINPGRAFLSSVPMIAVSSGVYLISGHFLPVQYRLIVSIIIAVLVYVPVSIRLSAIEEYDITMLPGGEKISFILKKIGIIKNKHYC